MKAIYISLLTALFCVATGVRSPALAQGPPKTRDLTVRITDSQGRPVNGVTVYLFEVGKECACANSNQQAACTVNAIAKKNTDKGKVEFQGLDVTKNYRACLEPRCGGRIPCQGDEQCQFAGNCKVVPAGRGNAQVQLRM